ncbi:hypothetical protein IXZ18_11065 (plasmid) [Campylobacter fetus subsp. venerealis bv. intermedius]|uniref:hypothetical protein n=1 Tax=Campylobacter fetus TaxID=196 RepID=UPI0003D819DA|nr:hypothetical protein [Campylobacter fetus]AHE95257.1 hypothetical protein CFVI03293_B0008 [Campylobacter fetus subsp. venerealis cfvi03/293]OCS23630.1 hypothetical protein CFVI9825_08190 [Campylobacter fetus subsp. venerealis cfvi9825]WKW28111.1 hypothetical protein IXZ24_10915 [Campylobacter fetus subsp. venerealis bv. intermedius]WKW30237.1 hypothetical protein IXZ18_11065 [Campylobacter fetus subsp. venerealis bv. intermedius]
MLGKIFGFIIDDGSSLQGLEKVKYELKFKLVWIVILTILSVAFYALHDTIAFILAVIILIMVYGTFVDYWVIKYYKKLSDKTKKQK